MLRRISKLSKILPPEIVHVQAKALLGLERGMTQTPIRLHGQAMSLR